MVQCEMCGAETASPNRVKIEGAELEVCDECTDFGTELTADEGESTTSTKYSTGGTSSTGSSGGSSGSGSSSSSTGSGSGGGSRRDMFDDIDEVAQDFDEQLRSAREGAGLSQEELAKKLNEKASSIRKLEHGETLPTDEMQRKLERQLDIDLTAGGSGGDTEWDGSSSGDGYTLGDVVERKDS